MRERFAAILHEVSLPWHTEKNWRREGVNYGEYRFSWQELLRYGAVAGAALFALAYVFYDSWIPVPFLYLPVLWCYLKAEKQVCINRRKAHLKKEFLTGVNLLGDYLRSGYAVENALRESVEELSEVWGEDSDIVREWNYMIAQMQISRAVEQVWADFGQRSQIEEIRNFSEIFGIVKRSGGQLSVIVSRSASQLSRSFSAEEQIENGLASKKFEQKIMNVMPLGILAYIKFSSPEFIAALYQGILGRVVMSVSLAVYLAAFMWSQRICDIKV